MECACDHRAALDLTRYIPHMKINEIMTTEVEVVAPDATIKDAAQRMARLNVGSLPVWDGERLVGMVTDRDLTVRAVAEGLDPAETSVRDCMSPKVVSCFSILRLSPSPRSYWAMTG